MTDFFNSRKWTPKAGNLNREKRSNRTSASTLLKVSRKQARMKLRTIERNFVVQQKRGQS